MSSNIDIEKSVLAEVRSVESIGKDVEDDHLAVHLPESLRGLSEAERHALDKAVTRKVDMLLMPAVFILYVLNYLDRQNITSAKIGGITKSLHMTSAQFSTCISVLFAGYIVFQIPSNMIAGKVAYPGIYICCWCAIWGVVSACTGAVRSYQGLAVCRLVLGFTEAAFFPGAVFLLSLFYTRKQLAFRTSLLFSGSLLGVAVGGLLALGILKLDGRHGLEGWRWLFIIEGAVTVGAALIFGLYIPNHPRTTRWLTPVERDALLYRLDADRGTKDATSETSVLAALKMAVTDPKVWMFTAVLLLNWTAVGVSNVFAILVAGLGFSRTTTLGLCAPPYVFGILLINLIGWHSDKKSERAYHVIGAVLFGMVGNIIAISTTSIPARYVAMMIMPGTLYGATIVTLGWLSTSITGPAIKRSIAISMCNSIGNISSVYTPYTYFGEPRYIVGFSVNVAACILCICVVLLLRLYLAKQNRRLDRGEDLGHSGPSKIARESGYRFPL